MGNESKYVISDYILPTPPGQFLNLAPVYNVILKQGWQFN